MELVLPELRRLNTHDLRTEYLRRVGVGVANAESLLSKGLLLFPSLENIRTAHGVIFGGVYEFAGQLRTMPIWVGEHFQAPPAREIRSLIDRARFEAIEMFSRGGIEDQCEAIARFHAELKRIQPFRDGNGRTAAFILDMQMQRCFDLQHELTLDGSKYRTCMEASFPEQCSVESCECLKDQLIDAAGLRDAVELERDMDRSR